MLTEMDFATGTVLDGRYRVEAPLGEGGMGRVYVAEDVATGAQVALKVLRPELGRNPDAAKRFEREVMVSVRLDHPNIVRVHGSGVLDGDSCYLVMELLTGESLANRLERDGRLPWRDAVDIIRGVVRGLGHAHLHNVIHRDIKPDNVFLVASGGVKLLDFGIAKLLDGDAGVTRNGVAIGTPAYLSPEQAIGGAITHAADLYSATVLLFEMLVGHTPFAELAPVEMVFAHVSKPAPSLVDLDVDAPLALVELVERGLEKRTADRIGSAADYLAALDAIAAPAARDVLRARDIIALGEAPTARVMYPTPPPAGSVDLPRAQPLAITSWMRKPRLPRLPRVTPRRRPWFTIACAMFAAAAAIGGLAGFASRSAAQPSPPPAPAPVVVTPPPAPTPKPAPAKPTFDDSLAQLRRGKTCADRRAAIARLVELGDPRAVPAIRKARHRTRANACLVAEADNAIRQLD
jgi:serine/threonine-protein kinase